MRNTQRELIKRDIFVEEFLGEWSITAKRDGQVIKLKNLSYNEVAVWIFEHSDLRVNEIKEILDNVKYITVDLLSNDIIDKFINSGIVPKNCDNDTITVLKAIKNNSGIRNKQLLKTISRNYGGAVAIIGNGNNKLVYHYNICGHVVKSIPLRSL